MAVNPQFLVAAVDLSEVFLDKDTGQPLSGGLVSFFQDNDHVTQKLVYTIQNNNPALPPNYTYVPLPNPITLSATGQFQDNAGNNIPVYYYPVDAAGNLQLYFIVVTNSNGVQQFTRQAWPPNESQVNPPPGGQTSGISNQITNSQFLDVNFVPANGITFNYVGNAIDTIPIAPGWVLSVNHTGNGTLLVARTAVAGSSAYPNNPPYTITVTPGLNIATLQLIQTLPNNPDVFSPALGGTNGWISASILLAPASIATISYQPNGQVAQLILNANNTSGLYTQFNNTIQLQPASNPSTGDTGSVNIVVGLSNTVPTTFSNIQIVPLNANIGNVPYDQRSANRERDYEFNYWNPLLQYKPIKSWLIGWDFPLNPAQFLSPIVAAIASGVNTSNYIWDQTIVFQSANSGISASQFTDGSLVLTSANVAGTRLALVQYLESFTANDILDDAISCAINIQTNQAAGIPCTIQLFYTTGTLPNIGANASLVATLNADGSVATFNNGSQPWVQIPRSNLGNASFNIPLTGTRQTFGLSGWQDTTSGAPVATFFAIVVGFGTLTHNNTLTIGNISAVPGQIPTIPAPQTQSEALLSCNRYYAKSFPQGVVPAQNTMNNSGAVWFPSTVGGAAGGICHQVMLPTTMAKVSPTYTFYNPQAGNAFIWNYNTTASFTATTLQQAGNKSFAVNFTSDAGCMVGHVLGFHFTADARLGF